MMKHTRPQLVSFFLTEAGVLAEAGILAGVGILAVVGLSACAHQVVAPSNTQPAPASVVSAWTELGPGGVLEARAVVSSGECPAVTVDGKTLAMKPRLTPSEAFPLPICEVNLPDGAKEAAVDAKDHETKLATLPQKVERILVIGDTGCRVKKNKDGSMRVQDCNDSSKWPFTTVAKSGARWKPDLIIHVGDYHYREAACPADHPGCENETPGDRWASWNQDFIVPAAPLLGLAPWIFVRGNHEICDRGGLGWNALLEPRPYSSKCTDATDGYKIDIGDHQYVVLDAADDANIQPTLDKMKPTSGKFLWLLLHRPILVKRLDEEAKHPVHLPKQFSRPGRTQLVLVGHIHTSSLSRFDDARPPELITGNSGTALDSVDFRKYAGMKVDQYSDFGFMTLERSGGDSWKSIAHDQDGKALTECSIKESKTKKTAMDCTAVK